MRKTMNLRGFAVVVGAMLVVFLVLFLILNARLNENRGAINNRRVTLTRLEDENKQMRTQLEQIGTENYIVSSAMNNYSFMNRNDLRFRFTNAEALYAYTEEEMKILMDEMAD